MPSNSNIDAIFLGKHTNKAVEVCDTLYPENKDVCTCWVAKAKQAIQQELLKAYKKGYIDGGIKILNGENDESN